MQQGSLLALAQFYFKLFFFLKADILKSARTKLDTNFIFIKPVKNKIKVPLRSQHTYFTNQGSNTRKHMGTSQQIAAPVFSSSGFFFLNQFCRETSL